MNHNKANESCSTSGTNCLSKQKSGEACWLSSQTEHQLLWENQIFSRESPWLRFKGTVTPNDLIHIRSQRSELSVSLCNPHSEMGAQSWPHCLVSQGLGGPGEVLGPHLTIERVWNADMQTGVRRDRQSPALVTAGLVTLGEIYVWNSSEGFGLHSTTKGLQCWFSAEMNLCQS